MKTFWESFSRKELGIEQQLDLLEKAVSKLGSRFSYQLCEEICAATRGLWYAQHQTYLFEPIGSAATLKRAKKIFEGALVVLRKAPREDLDQDQLEVLDGMIENIGERVEKLSVLGDSSLSHDRKISRLEEIVTKPEGEAVRRLKTSNRRAALAK